MVLSNTKVFIELSNFFKSQLFINLALFPQKKNSLSNFLLLNLVIFCYEFHFSRFANSHNGNLFRIYILKKKSTTTVQIFS